VRVFTQTLPLDFVCNHRRSVSPICPPLSSLFTRFHHVELPTPLLWLYLACIGPAPFLLPFTRFGLISCFFLAGFLGSLLFSPFFPVCVYFQVLHCWSSPHLFAAHRPLLGLFSRPHCDEFPTPLPFSIPGLCTIGRVLFLFFF
jgi:hypothetical protein